MSGRISFENRGIHRSLPCRDRQTSRGSKEWGQLFMEVSISERDGRSRKVYKPKGPVWVSETKLTKHQPGQCS